MRRLQTTGFRLALTTLIVALAVPSIALAQDASTQEKLPSASGDCTSFKWSLDAERQAFSSAAIEQVSSGAARGGWKQQAFVLALQPQADVPYTLPPTRRKKEAEPPRFGGIVAFAAPEKPAVYQVTLSSEGWIDLVQQGKALKLADHTGAKNCAPLRKSVRFAVDATPLVLQISGAPEQSIKVAIQPAD